MMDYFYEWYLCDEMKIDTIERVYCNMNGVFRE